MALRCIPTLKMMFISSSCGSNTDSGTCQSPSLEEPMEDESENEEFYNGLEDDADINERAGGTVFEADGGDQEAVTAYIRETGSNMH